jgi:hypothetical protein
MVGMKYAKSILVGKLKRRDHLEDVGLDGGNIGMDNRERG